MLGLLSLTELDCARDKAKAVTGDFVKDNTNRFRSFMWSCYMDALVDLTTAIDSESVGDVLSVFSDRKGNYEGLLREASNEIRFDMFSDEVERFGTESEVV